jgi:signal transduction histidine kinase
LRHAAVGGPDDPPTLAPRRPAWLRRAVPGILGVLAFGLVLNAVDIGSVYGLATQVVWAVSVVPLAVVAYRPLLAWRIAWLAALLTVLDPEGSLLSPGFAPFQWYPGQIWVFVVVLFAVGTAQERGVLLWVWLPTLVLAWAGINEPGRAAAALVVTGLLAWGYLIRRRSLTQRRLAEAQERGSVLAERARIARELHDVVAHHMSMIAVRTETAPYRLGDLPESARAEFAEISQASREALTEMRRLLGVLRSDEPELATAPQPGLANLPELVASARTAGTEVTLDVDATLRELPAGVDVSAYRIVQEALTNAARHAPGARVRVVVGRTGHGLSLSVRNGPGRPSRSEPGPGHGVRGMRERAAMLGGELRAGPSGDGGFEVSATLPLRAAE